METSKPKIIVIAGPTASGKSDLGVLLAKKFDGEVVSADSRQVYTGMDVGSGKITKKEMKGIPHHLLDVANPKRTYSVAQYQKAAHHTIADILKRGKLPIVVGGTGFYIQSIVDNISLPEVKPNQELRKELSKNTPAELFIMLKKLDPNRAKEIDAHNPHRLIRAIEIATALGKIPPLKKENKYNVLEIGINPGQETLITKIQKRLEKRLGLGMTAEVEKLHKDGLSWQILENFGLEYRFIAQFLQSKISRLEMKNSIQAASLQYAKRQMTWFKKDTRIIWVTKPEEAAALVNDFLKKD